MARDIILNLAISLDGFICDEDGGFAWISGQGDVRADTADHFDFDGFLASCDTIVMGRKAYEDCLQFSARSGGKAIPGGLPDTSGAGGQGCLSLRRCGGGSSGAEGPARQAHLAVRRWRAGLRLHSRRRRRPVYRRHPAGDPGQGPAAVSGGDSRRWNSTWTAARSQTASLFWSTAGGAGKADRQQPQGAFPAAVVL